LLRQTPTVPCRPILSTQDQLEQKQEATDSGAAAYEQDFGWFETWINRQPSR